MTDNTLYEKLPANQEQAQVYSVDSDDLEQLPKRRIIIEYPTSKSRAYYNRRRYFRSALTESEWTDYKWGSQSKKQVKGTNITRIYYDCANRDTTLCPVKMSVDKVSNIIINRKFNVEEHNHPAPTVKRIYPQIRGRITELANQNESPSSIHGTLVLDADKNNVEITEQNVPTKNNIRQIIHRYMTSKKSTVDATNNTAQETFLLYGMFAPKLLLVLMDPSAVELLIQYGKTIYFDSSVTIEEEGLFLSSILINPFGDFTMPIAWLVSEDRTEKAYQTFFEVLIEQSEDKWQPTIMLGDFDTALHNACQAKFPRAVIFGDSFQFMIADSPNIARHYNRHQRIVNDYKKEKDINLLVQLLAQEWRNYYLTFEDLNQQITNTKL